MEMQFDELGNHESRDPASPRLQPTLESSNMVANLGLPESDASLGIDLNVGLTMRRVAYESYQEQDQAATR
jgi:hypothetical protein